jgi:hypothetical protein
MKTDLVIGMAGAGGTFSLSAANARSTPVGTRAAPRALGSLPLAKR